MSYIPVYSPYLRGNVAKYVADCVDSGWISSRGDYVSKFEECFARYVGADAATSVSNGTVALHLALVALGVGPGDEVIVPTFTYIASVNTILQAGAKPVFVDSLEQTLQVDPVSIAKAITSRTRAVMAVHLYGHPCDMTQIELLCRKNSLWLVEDCAEGVGTWWQNRHVGTFGDVATFSFFGNKTITTGEGGMVLARDPAVMARCRHLKSQGVSSTREYWHDVLGFNYRMTNIQAAIGLSQLELVNEIIMLKRSLAGRYKEGLKGLPLRFFDEVGDVVNSYWMCSVLLDHPSQRDPLRKYLAARGIETRPFFALAHEMPHCRADGRFPVAKSISSRGINLPSSPALTGREAASIIDSIRSFFKGCAEREDFIAKKEAT